MASQKAAKVSDYDKKADDLARRHARSTLKPPERLVVIVDRKRSEVEISELDRTATRTRGLPKRIGLDPAQLKRIFGDY